ncbi:MAG: 4Fe-4S binding protein [Candidatus Omnitrophota bacterium]
MRKLTAARRLSQTAFFALFVYILWSMTYPLTGILPPETFFRINPLIMIFTSITERLVLPGILFSLGMIALTLILGRFFCGWVCPLGSSIDLVGCLRKKIPRSGDAVNAKLRAVKFFFLGIIAVISVLGVQVAWILDPMSIFARFVSLNLIPFVTLGLRAVFVFLIRDIGLRGPLYDHYRMLKETVLGVQAHYFSNSGVILFFFVIVCASALMMKRFWCRSVCPLGALYAALARFSLLRRKVDACVNCMKCRTNCRTGAIKDDISYVPGECVLCMDCVYDCPERGTRFGFSPAGRTTDDTKPAKSGPFLSRRNFLLLASSSLLVSGFTRPLRGGQQRRRLVIRPPASLNEEDFPDRCVRCGNCMKVCPTNGLQPVMFGAGLDSVWTPQLVPEIGYCEYRCTLCGNVCPTGAIRKITRDEKMYTKLGYAIIDRSICLPWSVGRQCIVCQEHCPVANKAIKIDKGTVKGNDVYLPRVETWLCVGCGICQNKCPVRPVRAIRVKPV